MLTMKEQNRSTRVKQFRETVWAYYSQNRRSLPWREGIDEQDFGYKVLVSEFMLQQTQVPRVVPKFEEFMRTYPTLSSLSAASLADVLRAWQGLGYNRRAKFLHDSAYDLMQSRSGQIPSDIHQLRMLPGVGSGTAAAIRVYAHNLPAVFVETNIRAVFLFHFFPTQQAVRDAELLPYIEQTQEENRPREWYWALMDYGTYLKQTSGNHTRRSAHYVKQTPFEGSVRQLRSRVLTRLAHEPATYQVLRAEHLNDQRLPEVMRKLAKEGLISRTGERYSLPEHQNTHDTIDVHV